MVSWLVQLQNAVCEVKMIINQASIEQLDSAEALSGLSIIKELLLSAVSTLTANRYGVARIILSGVNKRSDLSLEEVMECLRTSCRSSENVNQGVKAVETKDNGQCEMNSEDIREKGLHESLIQETQFCILGSEKNTSNSEVVANKDPLCSEVHGLKQEPVEAKEIDKSNDSDVNRIPNQCFDNDPVPPNQAQRASLKRKVKDKGKDNDTLFRRTTKRAKVKLKISIKDCQSQTKSMKSSTGQNSCKGKRNARGDLQFSQLQCYLCVECTVYVNEDALYDHVRETHGQLQSGDKRPSLSCTHCGKKFGNAGRFRKSEETSGKTKINRSYAFLFWHLVEEHGHPVPDFIQKYACNVDQCDFVSYEETELVEHMRERHKQKYSPKQEKFIGSSTEDNVQDDELQTNITVEGMAQNTLQSFSGMARLQFLEIRCFLCLESPAFDTVDSLYKHARDLHLKVMKDTQEERPYIECPNCNKQVSVTRKSKKEGNKKLMANIQQCLVSVLRHLVRKHNFAIPSYLRNFSCPYDGCDFVSAVQIEVNTHVKQAHEFVQVPCEICGKLIRQQFVAKHALNCSKSTDERNAESDSTTRLQCDHCDKTFKSDLGLKCHVQTKHTKEFRFLCDHCPQQFLQRCLLVYHLYTNHGIKTKETKVFNCSQCEFKTPIKAHLARHFREVHESVTLSEQCQLCSKAFFTKYLLNRHLKRVHTGSTYQCEQCHYSTRCKRSYTTHVRAIHEGRKHSCVCSYQTGFFSNLIKHRKLCREYRKQQMTDDNGAIIKETSEKNIGVKGDFACKGCGYTTTIRGHLINHQRFCKGDKPKPTRRSKVSQQKPERLLQKNLTAVVSGTEGCVTADPIIAPQVFDRNPAGPGTENMVYQQVPTTFSYYYDPMTVQFQ